MTDNLPATDADEFLDNSEFFKSELQSNLSSKQRRILEKIALAALSTIPWVGGFISAAASIKSDEETLKQNTMQTQWLGEHQKKINSLNQTLGHVAERISNIDQEVEERIQSDEYLDLVRKTFRAWDQADTEEKRRYAANLIANAAGTKLCSDDVIRLFIDWLNKYHEAHLGVIRFIYQHPGCTRYEIWMNMHGEVVAENSAEADLYKLLIRDLSTGGVIRQHRDTTYDGQFIKKSAPRSRKGSGSKIMKSAFDDAEQYVLTELGKQFVHYTMNEVVSQIEGE